MRSINIYRSTEKEDKRRERPTLPRRRSVQNRFIAVECMVTAAAMAKADGAPCGGYLLLPDGLGRMVSGELKLKMCSNEFEMKERSENDA